MTLTVLKMETSPAVLKMETSPAVRKLLCQLITVSSDVSVQLQPEVMELLLSFSPEH